MTELTTLWQIARGRLYLRLPMLALPLGLLRPGEAKIDRLGTDGARLSYEGLPCPNLCTGGENYHGR